MILRMALPLMVAQAGLVAMGLVDTAVVGHHSAADLAGTSIARGVGFGVGSLGLGIAMSVEPLAAQAVGAEKPGRAYGALRASVRLLLQLGVPTIAAIILAVYALPSFGIDAATARSARVFAVTNAPSLVLFHLYVAARSYCSAFGDTRAALRASLLANVFNLLACNLLVAGDGALRAVGLPAVGLPALGAAGAGLATTMAAGVLCLSLWPTVRRLREREPEEPVSARAVWQLGAPTGLALLAEIGVFSLAGVLAGRFGARAVAAHQVAMGLASFTFMAANGVAGATASRVGNEVGAGRSPRRVGLLGVGAGLAVMCSSAALFAWIPGPLVRLFTTDPEVLLTGVQLMGLAAVFQAFDGAQTVLNGALRGAGDVRAPFFISVAAYWVLGLPVSLVLGARLGVVGLWWGLTLGLVVVAFGLGARFLWLTRPSALRA